MRWRFAGMALLLVVLLVAGLAQSQGRAADPEPKVIVYPDENFDPGPGWPAGWGPPVMPKTIRPERQVQYEEIKARQPVAERPTQLKLYEWKELPNWTKEYPYFLEYHYTLCGKTVYLYYTPYPDLDLVTKMTGRFHPGVSGISSDPCTINPVAGIKYPMEMTDDEREQWRLHDDLNTDMGIAKQGLPACNEWTNGAPQNIYVCFNRGDASVRFDAPAYLDLSVGRVRVPVRFVSELMGATVTWDDPSQTVTIAFPGASREVAKLVLKPGRTMAEWWRHQYKEISVADTMVKKVVVTQPAKTIKLTVSRK